MATVYRQDTTGVTASVLLGLVLLALIIFVAIGLAYNWFDFGAQTQTNTITSPGTTTTTPGTTTTTPGTTPGTITPEVTAPTSGGVDSSTMETSETTAPAVTAPTSDGTDTSIMDTTGTGTTGGSETPVNNNSVNNPAWQY